jgi:hypothetical protein
MQEAGWASRNQEKGKRGKWKSVSQYSISRVYPFLSSPFLPFAPSLDWPENAKKR